MNENEVYLNILNRFRELKNFIDREINEIKKDLSKFTEHYQNLVQYFDDSKYMLTHCCICGKWVPKRDGVLHGCYFKAYNKMICYKHYYELKGYSESADQEKYYLFQYKTKPPRLISNSQLKEIYQKGTMKDLIDIFSWLNTKEMNK